MTTTTKIIILQEEAFDEIIRRLERLEILLTEKKKPGEIFLDNTDFMKMMKISKRTAQNWRDEGKISFSEVGRKIYYSLADVEELLKSNYNKAFARKR